MTKLACLMSVCLAGGFPEMATASDPRWMIDYDHLKAEMEIGYANLPWFASPQGGVNIPRLDQRTREELGAAETEEEARLAIRHFVEGFGDGHFAVLPQRDPAMPSPEPAERSTEGLDAGDACAAMGYGNRSQVAFSAPFESLPDFTLVDAGDPTMFRAGTLKVGDHLIAVVRIRSFSPIQYPTACEAVWRSSTSAERASDEFSDRVQEEWLRVLADTVARLAEAQPAAMLIDVGSNSGGNDSGDWAARIFTDRPLRSARMLMPAGLVARYVDAEGEVLQNAISQADAASAHKGRDTLAGFASVRDAARRNACDLSWVWQEQRAWRSGSCDNLADVGFASGLVTDYQDPDLTTDQDVARQIYWPTWVDPWRGTWRGRTYVLTNSASFSSAEMFAAVLQNNGAAKIIGSRTGGDGCGWAVTTEPVTLAALSMQVRLPNCVRLRSNADDEVAGVSPDLPVPSRQGQSLRMRAAEIATSLVADLQREVEP